jgi:hypothetical protein
VSSKWRVVSAAVADCAAAYSKGDRARAAHLAKVASRLALRTTPSSARDKIIESLADLSNAIEAAALVDEVENHEGCKQ